MRDRSLNDDSLKLVKYRVLFVKRGYEAVLADDSGMVHDNLTPEGFVAWKISEFSRHLDTVRVPAAWGGTATERPRYPKAAVQGTTPDGQTVWFINQLDDDDHKYLRVAFEVLNRSARERFEYEEDQVDVLRQIRDAISGPCSPSDGSGAPAGGGAAAGGGATAGSPPAGPGGSAPAPSPGGGAPGWVVV